MKAASNTTKVAIVAAGVLLANLLDLASTYAVSPDLAGEWNILERQFGLGWTGLIGVKLLGWWVAVLGYTFYVRRREACYPAGGASLSRFAHHFTFGPTVGEGDAEAPSYWTLLGVNLGYFWTGIQLLVVWVALDNLLLRYGIFWSIRHVSELGYHLLQSVVVGAAVAGRFYLGNYRRYLTLRRASGLTPLGLTKAGDCANLRPA